MNFADYGIIFIVFIIVISIIFAIVFFNCTLPGALYIVGLNDTDEIGNICLWFGGMFIISTISSIFINIIQHFDDSKKDNV